ncbi:MAG: hypothetical protein IJN32_06230, partial [Thermoguttaceae bacterium]|nr:hypothetical protein [Thermoguttaceae bacterium]
MQPKQRFSRYLRFASASTIAGAAAVAALDYAVFIDASLRQAALSNVSFAADDAQPAPDAALRTL